jgi:hypothetical protein
MDEARAAGEDPKVVVEGVYMRFATRAGELEVLQNVDPPQDAESRRC